MTRPHPIQPLELDHRGVLRFKANAIVRHLLDNGGIDMNALAREDFTREDREQFAQLIGYSHSGSGDLSYVSDAVWYAAQAEYEARIDAESPAGTALASIPVEATPVVSTNDADCGDKTLIQCPRCLAHMPVVLYCGGAQCPLRK